MTLYDVVVETPDEVIIVLHTTENKNVADKVLLAYAEEETNPAFVFTIFKYEVND